MSGGLDSVSLKRIIAHLAYRLTADECRRSLGLASVEELAGLVDQAARIGERSARRELAAQTPQETTR